MKIMIVDDNSEMRRLVRTSLQGVAEDFVECADGAEAVAAFDQHRPDWTVMDIGMEKVDGLEATRQILARFAGARVVILTQHDSAPMRQAATEAGACAFLPKEDLLQIGKLVGASNF